MAFELFQVTTYAEDGSALPSVELNARCIACEGSGIEVDRANRTFNDCAACGKTGSRLTWTGRELMRFVGAHTGHIDIDAADEDLQD